MFLLSLFYSPRMKATDSTLWTVVPLGYFKNHLDLFLPRRYCSKCFRDNAEAAQSRRELHQKLNCALSDGGGAIESEPCDMHKDVVALRGMRKYLVRRAMEAEPLRVSPATCTKIVMGLRAMREYPFAKVLGPLASFGLTDMRLMR